MSNKWKAVLFQDMSTSHIGGFFDINTPGKYAHYYIPFITRFAGCPISIGLVVPAKGDEQNTPIFSVKNLSIFWMVRLSQQEYPTLIRPGYPDSVFLPSGSPRLFYCPETRETLEEKTDSEGGGITIRVEDGTRYFFAGSGLVEKIVFTDGTLLSIRLTASLLSISTPRSDQGISFHAEFALSAQYGMTSIDLLYVTSIDIYRLVGGSRENLTKASVDDLSELIKLKQYFSSSGYFEETFSLSLDSGRDVHRVEYQSLPGTYEHVGISWLGCQINVSNVTGSSTAKSASASRTDDLVYVSSAITGETVIYLAPESEGKLPKIHSFCHPSGLCSCTSFDSAGRLFEEIPLGLHASISESAIRSVLTNGFFEKGSARWSLDGGATITDSPTGVYTCFEDAGENWLVIPAGGSAETNVFQWFNPDTPLLLMLGLARRWSSKIQAASLKATISLRLNDGSVKVKVSSIDSESIPMMLPSVFGVGLAIDKEISSVGIKLEGAGAEDVFVKFVTLEPWAATKRYFYNADSPSPSATAIGNVLSEVINGQGLLPSRDAAEANSANISYLSGTSLPEEAKDSLGGVTSFSYRARGSKSSGLRLSSLRFEAFDGQKYESRFRYDSRFFPAEEWQNGVNASRAYGYRGESLERSCGARKAGILYDSRLYPTQLYWQKGDALHQSHIAYSEGRPSTFSDGAGVVASLTYDSYANVTKTSLNGIAVQEIDYGKSWERQDLKRSIGGDTLRKKWDTHFLNSKTISRADKEMQSDYFDRIGSFPSGERSSWGLIRTAKFSAPENTSSISESDGQLDFLTAKQGDSITSDFLDLEGPYNNHVERISSSFPVYSSSAEALELKYLSAGCSFSCFAENSLNVKGRGGDICPEAGYSAVWERYDHSPAIRVATLAYTLPAEGGFVFGFAFTNEDGPLVEARNGSFLIELFVAAKALYARSKQFSQIKICSLSDEGHDALLVSITGTGMAEVSVGASHRAIGFCGTPDKSSSSLLLYGVARRHISCLLFDNRPHAAAWGLEFCRDAFDYFGPKTAAASDGTSYASAKEISILPNLGFPYGQVRCIPLNGTLLPSGGSQRPTFEATSSVLSPSEWSEWLGSDNVVPPSKFRWSGEWGRPAYLAVGDRLEYGLSNAVSLWLSILIKPFSLGDSNRLERTIFEVAYPFFPISVSVKNGVLHMDLLGESMSTGILVKNGIEAEVLFSCSQTIESSGSTRACTFSCSLMVPESQPFQVSRHFTSPLGYVAILSIGRKREEAGEANPFYGLISDILFGQTDLSADQLRMARQSCGRKIIRQEFDSLGRLVSQRYIVGQAERSHRKLLYEECFRGGDVFQTGRVSRAISDESKTGSQASTGYSYDDSGCLSGIDDDAISYEARGFLSAFGKETYVYDESGNLVRKNTADGAFSYTYLSGGLPNRLASFSNGAGQQTLYFYPSDQSGLPSLMTRNGSAMSFNWAFGRMTSMSQGNKIWSYFYDPEGRLTKKISSDETHLYSYSGSSLILDYCVGRYSLLYSYDSFENPISVVYKASDGASYSYSILTDSFGAITAIVSDRDGSKATVQYDPWGKVIDIFDSTQEQISSINHLLFKGYLFDEDTGFYVLGPRHYDPLTGRFLEPDNPDFLDGGSPSGLNLYAYCSNDPVNYSDRSGHFPTLLGMILIGAAVGALSYTASEVVSYGLTGEWSWSWGQFAGSVFGGAVGGALMASGAGAFVVGFGSGFVSTATGMSLQNAFEGTNYSADRILGLSLINGFISGGIAMLPSIGIPRITTGRNSFAAISASITKKYVNGTIRNMALKTMGKMFTYNLVASAFDVAWSGFSDATGFDDSAYDYSQLIYGWLHI